MHIAQKIGDAVKNPDIMVIMAVAVMIGIKKIGLPDLMEPKYWYIAIAVLVTLLATKDGKFPISAGFYASGLAFLMDIPTIGVPLFLVAALAYFLISILRGIEEEKGRVAAVGVAFICIMVTGPIANKMTSQSIGLTFDNPSEWRTGIPSGL